MSYVILTDTSANIPTGLLSENGIDALACNYYIDDSEYSCTDTETFDSAAFYGAIRGGTRVSTSLIPPERYTEWFRTYLEKGEDVLFVSMSSGISGSCEKACMAAGELMEQYPQRHIEIVDSLGASLGEGLLALHAAKLKKEGLCLEDNARALRQMVPRMCQVFTVDDLMHLRRTGRLSNAAAVVATVLNIKPLLKGNEDGKIVSFAKLLGRKRSIEAIAEQYKKLVVEPETQTIGIAHADCLKDAQYLIELIKRSAPPKDILLVDYEPVTGSHVGPGALALFFIGSEQFRPGVKAPSPVEKLREALPEKLKQKIAAKRGNEHAT